MTALRTRYALLPLLGLALAGCGGGGTGGASTAAPATPTAAPTGSPRAAGVRVPGTSGLVAAVSGSTAQVQSTDSQTAVTWTGTTTFTDTVAGTAADVTVGSCVVVRSADPAAGTGATPTPASAVTATAVTVSAAVDGSCAGGAAGGGFGRGGAGSGMRPSGAPDPSASPGRRGLRGAGGGGAFGTVTAVTSGGFTVESTRPAGAPTPSAAPTAVTVTTTPATTYARTAPASAAAVQVGLCLTATGQPDSTGAVTAARIALRPAVDGACGTGRPGGAGA